MKQPLIVLLLLCLLVIMAIKFVPSVNNLARESLPAPLLKAMGEKPKGILEQQMDDFKKLVAP